MEQELCSRNSTNWHSGRCKREPFQPGQRAVAFVAAYSVVGAALAPLAEVSFSRGAIILGLIGALLFLLSLLLHITESCQKHGTAAVAMMAVPFGLAGAMLTWKTVREIGRQNS